MVNSMCYWLFILFICEIYLQILSEKCFKVNPTPTCFSLQSHVVCVTDMTDASQLQLAQVN